MLSFRCSAFFFTFSTLMCLSTVWVRIRNLYGKKDALDENLLHANKSKYYIHSLIHQTSCNVFFLAAHFSPVHISYFSSHFTLLINYEYMHNTCTITTVDCDSNAHTRSGIRTSNYFPILFLFLFFSFQLNHFHPMLRAFIYFYLLAFGRFVYFMNSTYTKINIIWWISRLCDIEMIECNFRLISRWMRQMSKRNQAGGTNTHTHSIPKRRRMNRKRSGREKWGREWRYHRNSFICFLLQCQN